jgi:hypothetical protein
LERQTELDDSEYRVKRDANAHFIAVLTNQGLIDPHRLGITGMSDGAETVFDMLVTTPIFAAAIASNGPSDSSFYWLQSADFRALRQRQFGLTPPWDESHPEWARWYARTSTTAHANAIGAALLMNLPETETLSAFPLITRLETTTTPVETFIYPGAYHIKWRPGQIAAVQQRTLDWMSFWLLERDPSDADETERWRAMRARRAAHHEPDAATPPASP